MKHTPRTVRTAKRPSSDMTRPEIRRDVSSLTVDDLHRLYGLVQVARIGARSRS